MEGPAKSNELWRYLHLCLSLKKWLSKYQDFTNNETYEQSILCKITESKNMVDRFKILLKVLKSIFHGRIGPSSHSLSRHEGVIPNDRRFCIMDRST